jgi:acyl-coenzyme A thioesterase PaaI-like protein
VELSLEHDGNGAAVVVGNVTFASAYEGPPGHVHGGYLAAAFDEVLGLAQGVSGAPGMTARLTVNYRKPTPWGMPLRFEGRIERREGRKVFTTGTCYAGDLLTAEAEALFISVDFTRLAELAADRQRRTETR